MQETMKVASCIALCLILGSLIYAQTAAGEPMHSLFALPESYQPYQAEDNNTSNGNPFENFTPEQLFDPSSPLAILGYLSAFFCLTIPISLLILAIASIAIFVRLGKIRKELSQLNQARTPQNPQPPMPPQMPGQMQAPQQSPQQGKQF